MCTFLYKEFVDHTYKAQQIQIHGKRIIRALYSIHPSLAEYIMSEEEQFNQAFGEHTGISKEKRERINNVRQLAQVQIVLRILHGDCLVDILQITIT